jgi:hypothetical protein
MVFIFLYNVVYIKTDFKKIQALSKSKLILIGTPYCFKYLTSVNRSCFDHIHQISRDFQNIDYSEVDAIIKMYVDFYGSENIRILSNEDSVHLVCADLREKYQIPGYNKEQLLPYVDKVISKNKLNNVVRIPKFSKFNKIEYADNKFAYLNKLVEQLGWFPLFAKPVDLVSSVETHTINNMTEFFNIAERILSHDYEFEVDEFIDGDLFHCDAMIIGGEVKFFMIGKCSFALARFFDGKPVGSIPVVDKKVFNTLEEFCNKVFKQLDCHDSAYHMEVFLEYKTNEFVFLEIGARTAGALVSRVYKKLFDINIEEVNYLIQMGLINDVEIKKENIYAGFLNFPMIKGEVVDIIKPNIDIDHEFIRFVRPQEKLNQAQNLLDISCSIIFWDKYYEKVEHAFEYLKDYNPLQLKGEISWK